MQNRCEIHTLVKRRGLGGAIADPRGRKSRFAAFLESKCDAGKNGREGSHLAHRGDHAIAHVTYVKVRAVTGRVGCGKILAKHVRDRYPHFMAGAGISDHRTDLTDSTIQGMDAADRYSFLTSTQPGFCENSLADPAPEGDIVKSKAQHPGIHRQKLVLVQLGNDLVSLTILL